MGDKADGSTPIFKDGLAIHPADIFITNGKVGIVLAIGTADPWSTTGEIIQLARKNRLPLHVYDDCNHSLECGDTERNLEILRDVMKKTKEFLVEK